MTWYQDKNKRGLDKWKPIGAVVSFDMDEILLPRTEHDSYEVIGFDWFNLTMGCWNSCRCFKTVEEAIAERDEAFNVEIRSERTK